MSDCLFCKIAAGEIPSTKVYEDEICYAFKDIAPQAPVHFLVVPKEHIRSVSEITGANSSIVGHIFEVIAKLAEERPDVVSREDLMMVLWETDEYVSDGTLTILVSRLRSRLRTQCGQEIIGTRKGQGYYLL